MRRTTRWVLAHLTLAALVLQMPAHAALQLDKVKTRKVNDARVQWDADFHGGRM